MMPPDSVEGAMDDDKEKSVIDKFVDTVTTAVGQVAKAAVTPNGDPKAEPDPEAIAEKSNEQVYLRGDAAIAPETVPAPAPPAPKKNVAKKATVKLSTAKRPPPKKTAKKAVGKNTAKKSVKRSKKSTPKKTTKAAKKSAKKGVKKTKKKSKKPRR